MATVEFGARFAASLLVLKRLDRYDGAARKKLSSPKNTT
jgi:hypothetical protein